MTENVTNDYDAVPYESYPYPRTHPEHLFTVGKLFGLDAPSPQKCKVLELGCASGGNIIPMAVNFPDSEFVGIDLSKVQIDEGTKHIEKLGIKNLSLQNISILDIDEKFGKFDYIIVHGILSWVSKDVQDKIFEICEKNLTKKGIAYISYNTLPGWNMIKSIREMMLYHTAGFADPAKKTSEARKLLEFIKEGNNVENPYIGVINSEIKTLSTAGDSYLAHDHLEENNEPFYFKDFAERAAKNKLQYLGETEISTMFVGNFPENTAKILMQAKDDVIRTEQYMDFIRNRRFRSTLLCHSGTKLNRNLGADKISEFYLSSTIRPQKDISEIDLTKNEEVAFTLTNGSTLNTTNKAVIAALTCLAEQKEPIHSSDLVEIVKKRLGNGSNKDDVQKIVFENIIRLALAGAINLHALPAKYINKLTEKPKVSELSRYQATYSGWITTQRNEKVNIDLVGRVLIQYLDGENNFDSIVENMVKHVVNNDLELKNKNGEKITDAEAVKKDITILTKKCLDNLVPNAVLVA